MGAKDLRRDAQEAFQQRREQLRADVRAGNISPIQQRVKAIVDIGQTNAFAEATHLSLSRVEKIAGGTQNPPDNENKRALFMDQLVEFERHFGLLQQVPPEAQPAPAGA